MSIIHSLTQHGIDFEQMSRSSEILLHCPACVGQGQHVTYGKLYVNAAKGVGMCQRCGWKGNEAALLRLLDIAAVQAPLALPEEPPLPSYDVTPFPPEAIPALESNAALDYLCRERHLMPQQLETFGLFYAPEGRYARRVIVPICDRLGRYRTFLARTIDTEEPKRYLNPPGAKLSQWLYNLHFLPYGAAVWLVEGVFDAIHCFPHAVATFGKHISQQQMTALGLHGVWKVFVVYDAEAWQKTPKDYWATMHQLSTHFFTVSVQLPDLTPTEYTSEELHRMCEDAQHGTPSRHH
jgi:hypothetical protein